jgi:tRNA(Ile)-lysidine synthase
MLQRFQQHIEREFSFLSNSKLLIAVSGGIDSVVLAHLSTWMDFDFAICHCNFKLRGEESDDDEAFVTSLAKDLGVPVFTTHFETEQYAKEHKLSIQVAARNLRYRWFYELLEEHDYEYVLTAHNTNDNLETFLINLSRGTGLEGLTGIPPINQKSVRPLLNFSRDDIMMYAIKNGIVWREDRSNASIKYVRNKVRHQILPILKEINPHLLETFKDTLEYLNESQEMVQEKVDDISKKILTVEDELLKLNITKLKRLKNTKAYLYQVLHSYGFTEWNDVLNLLDAQPGKQVFSKTHRLLKDRGVLILTTITKDLLALKPVKIDASTTQIAEPIRLELQKTDLDSTSDHNAILVDKDLLKYPLSVRKWGYGDYICPTGMQGSKKLSQLFKDKKLSLIDKEKIWLLTDAEDNIVWVIGLRQDRRFAASETTQNRLKISYTP